MDPKSKEAKALSKALGALGSAGDKNGVTVSFGKTLTNSPMETSGMHITVDYKLVDAGQKAWNDAGYSINGEVDEAADDVHEGTHVAANKRGAATNESDAYRAQSYTSEAGHSNNTSGVWNESWANGPDKEVLRTAAIKEAAGRSEAATKTYEDKQKK